MRMVVAIVMGSAASVAADPAWQAPAACPDAAAVRERIEARLGRTLDDADDVEIDVEKSGKRYIAHVDLAAVTVANDVRTVSSTRCDDLADAVAVIVARAAGERRRPMKHVVPDRSVAPKPTLAMRDADDPTPEIVATVEAPHVRVWSFDVRISGVSGIGVIPQVGLGGELAVSLRHKSALAEVAETRWMMSAAQLHGGAPARVDVGLEATALRLGWRPPAMPLRGWASVEGGSMYGTGVQLESSQLGSGRWIAAGAGFGVAWPINRWVRLVGTTEIMIGIERVKFSLGDGMTVYAPSAASARATCGLEVGLP